MAENRTEFILTRPNSTRSFPFISIIAFITSMFFLATSAFASYQDGWNAIRDGNLDEALAQWEPLAKQGNDKALYALGWVYHIGNGIKPNYAKARGYYEKAAARKNTDAIFALGLMYQDGLGVRANLPKAMQYFRRTIQISGGHKQAEYTLGTIHFKGIGVPRSYGLAIEWYKKAARHDHPAAQYILASIYESGWGTKADTAFAYYWYTMAARHPTKTMAIYGADMNSRAALNKLKPTMTQLDLVRAKRMLKARKKASRK